MGLHFTQHNYGAEDMNISVLAFITLTPEGKDALALEK